MIGEVFAHYRVSKRIGRGGMGEVYRATDTRLGREVALKVLSDAFARDAHRMRRFEREAHLLAALNHPHIATIHGLEEAGDVRALVMELVSGPTLAERIARGALPIREALPIARQIAEALEYAHEHGIVHRDLKPANIKITEEGQVKVLDFGLAKALIEGASLPEEEVTLSMPATEAGMILGTAAYMSPEQATGQPLDRRTDIWSFGIVLYEMLTGRRPFSRAEVIGTRPTPLEALDPTTPWRVRELLGRCLERDSRRRLQAIGEARIALEDAIDDPRSLPPGVSTVTGPGPPKWRRILPWAASGLLAVALALLWAGLQPTLPPSLKMRLEVVASPDVSVVPGDGPAVALSPDGRMMAFRGRTSADERPRIFLRRLDQLEAVPLAGTDGVTFSFFSPDSSWLGFFADRRLKKIPVTGGPPVTLCEVQNARGGDWTEDGWIVFAPSSRSGLSRIPAAGGRPEVLTRLDASAGEITHRFPHVLPGGKAVVLTSHTSSVSFDDADIVVIFPETGERRMVLEGGYAARYSPSGHLLYMQRGTLFAAPFDLDRLAVTRSPVAVIERVVHRSTSALAQFSLAADGTLAYLPDQESSHRFPIAWVTDQGELQPTGVAGDYSAVRLSPDGRRLALQIREGSQSDIWVYDWDREILSRVTFDGTAELPLWTPDGRRIVFTSGRHGPSSLYWSRSDGAGSAEALTETHRTEAEEAGSWHPDGRTLAVTALNEYAGTFSDVMILSMEGDEVSGWRAGPLVPLLDGPFNERSPAFSPDGHWLAYVSTESGRAELYVRRFPELDGKQQISSGGASLPTWSRGAEELFYEADGTIMAVSYRVVDGEFRPASPRAWATVALADLAGARAFDVHPDGARLAVLTTPSAPLDRAVLFFDFFGELRRLVPRAK